MKLAQAKTLATARRIQGFFDAHPEGLGIAVPRSLRARLDAAVDRLDAYRLEQAAAQRIARSETNNQAVYRRDVYEQFIRPVGMIARHALRDAVEYRALVMPAASPRGRRFVARARILAKAAEEHADVFVDHGMSAEFIGQLQTALEEITTSLDARVYNTCRQAGATAGLAEAHRLVLSVVGILDSVLASTLRKHPALLAGWRASKRAGARARRNA